MRLAPNQTEEGRRASPTTRSQADWPVLAEVRTRSALAENPQVNAQPAT
jgi:hypothetical protein